MIEISIEPGGEAISDWQVESEVNGIIELALIGIGSNYKYSNLSILNCFRAELIENPEYQKYFAFYIDGELVKFNRFMAAK